jgi:soluble lytic murein transglycosylase-like protein
MSIESVRRVMDLVGPGNAGGSFGGQSFEDLLANALPGVPELDVGRNNNAVRSAVAVSTGDSLAINDALAGLQVAQPGLSVGNGLVPSGPLLDRADVWLPAIEDAAARHDFDPRLLTALVWSESSFVADAESHAGAVGLAQLMSATAAGMGLHPHDPMQNLESGARFLKAQLDRFERVDLALATYNAGPARVARTGGVPEIAETQAYVRIVTERYEHLIGASS